MAFPSQSVRFADVLLRLQTVLAARLGLPIESVPIVKSDKYAIPALAEYHVAIRPLGGPINGEIGSGRHALTVRRLVAIDVSVRNSIDDISNDSQALTEPDFGLYDREDAILEAVCVRPLIDDEGQHMLIEPIHPVDQLSGAAASPKERGTGFLSSTQIYELHYIPRITVTTV